MSDGRKLDIGDAIGGTLSAIFKNLPNIGKATLIPIVALMALTFYWFLPQFFPLVGALIEYADHQNDQALIASALGVLASVFVVLLLSLLVYGMTLAPLLRNVMFQEPVGFLRLDGLVMRTIVGLIIIFAIVYGLVLAFMIPVGVVQGILISAENDAGAAVVEMIAMLLLYVLMAYVMVRTSLILPDIVASGRLRVAAGWRASKGNFWQMFLTYFVVYVILTMMTYVGIIIAFFAIGFSVATNPAIQNMDWENFTVPMIAETYSVVMTSPGGIFMFVVLVLTSMLSIGAYAAMLSTIYKQLVLDKEATEPA